MIRALRPWAFGRPAVSIAAALICGSAFAQLTPGAVITYGSTSLGVNQSGELNFNGNGPGGTLLYGVYRNGVGDAISPGCPCEGWGVALSTHAGNRFATFANQTAGSGGFGALNSFGSTTTTATAVTSMADLPVTIRHAYGPSFAADVFQVQVTITNNGDEALQDLVYRRAMDWDVPPTEFAEYVTHQGVVANLVANGGNVLYAGNNGFADSDPTVDPTWGESIRPTFADPANAIETTNSDFNKAGPWDHGSVFDFSFGGLAAGQSRVFNIYYGSASNEAEALSKVNQVGANLYSLGQSSVGFAGEGGDGDGGDSSDETDGVESLTSLADEPSALTEGDDPAIHPTFLFAFGGVGGVEPGSIQELPILPFVQADGQFTFDSPVSRRWYDPPFATGFAITVEGGDMISIQAPLGFLDMQIVIDGVIVDTDFDGGEEFTFDPGVRSFKVTGLSIDLATTALSTAFPLFMDFENTVTSMTWVPEISAVPEISTYAMLLPGLGVLGWLSARRRKSAGC